MSNVNSINGNAAYVVLSDRLFIIGGYDREVEREGINSVKCYDLTIEKCQTVAPMLHRRAAPAACALNGLIYVLGGENDYLCIISIERYNTREDSWTEVSNTIIVQLFMFRQNEISNKNTYFFLIQLEFTLPYGRCWFSPVVIDGVWVYLAGGVEDNQDLDDFDKFNLITGEMVKLEPLHRRTEGCFLFKT